MKTSVKTLIALASLCWMAPIALHADVITDDMDIIDDYADYDLLHLSKSVPAGEGAFAIAIYDRGSGAYDFDYWSIAEEIAFYESSYGTAFVPALAAQLTPLVSNNGTDPGSSTLNFLPNQSRYFSYWDKRSAADSPNSDDHFGWVEMRWTGSDLEVLASATASEGGIVVGTTTQIPEPSTMALLGGGGLAIYLFRSKRNKSGRTGGRAWR